MNTELELQLLREIAELKRKVNLLEKKDKVQIPIYQYSKIRDRDLITLFEIERNLDPHRFDEWFNTPLDIDNSIYTFLTDLLDENKLLMDSYGEEDLKVKFIAPLLKKVHFTSYENHLRDFYKVPMIYATNRFIFNGTVDFVVAKGLIETKKPYFFIQEFKRSEKYGNPRPQLLAELISALELNQWISIKGAYIIGGSWHFVILEKLDHDRYQYFVSQNFDSTKMDDLISIYQHLVFVKHEIFSLIKAEMNPN